MRLLEKSFLALYKNKNAMAYAHVQKIDSCERIFWRADEIEENKRHLVFFVARQ